MQMIRPNVSDTRLLLCCNFRCYPLNILYSLVNHSPRVFAYVPRGVWAPLSSNQQEKIQAQAENQTRKPTNKGDTAADDTFWLQSGVKRCCPKAIFTFGLSVFVCLFPLRIDGQQNKEIRETGGKGNWECPIVNTATMRHNFGIKIQEVCSVDFEIPH